MLSCMKYCKVEIMNVNNFTIIKQQKEQSPLNLNNSTHKPKRTTIYIYTRDRHINVTGLNRLMGSPAAIQI